MTSRFHSAGPGSSGAAGVGGEDGEVQDASAKAKSGRGTRMRGSIADSRGWVHRAAAGYPMADARRRGPGFRRFWPRALLSATTGRKGDVMKRPLANPPFDPQIAPLLPALEGYVPVGM